jgi:hypothetical protein
MSILPRTVPSKKLAQALLSTDYSMVLNNIVDWDGGDLASGDFGTQLFAALTNDTKTKLELIEVDPATIASGSITILKRGLDFQGGQTEVPALALEWSANETTVALGTDIPQLFNNYVDFGQDQTIDGIKTFVEFPQKQGTNTPSSANEFATKEYVDATATGTATYDQQIIAGVAGVTIAIGDHIYFNTTTQKWELTDASAAATCFDVILGIAQSAGVLNDSINILLSGKDKTQSGMTPGATQYLQDTAGTIGETPGTVNVAVGEAESATDLIVTVPNELTEDQLDALAGTVGSPSDTNRYVTDDDTTGTGDVVRQSVVTPLVQFGGTGSDGALAIASGTTNINVGGARIYELNYTTIDITGTGQLTFSNPHAKGTLIIIKATGLITITSSASPAIDYSEMGAAGGAGGNQPTCGSSFGGNTVGEPGVVGQESDTLFIRDTWPGGSGGGGGSNVGGGGGAGQAAALASTLDTYDPSLSQSKRWLEVAITPGGGGGGGGGSTQQSGGQACAGDGGAGGRGGGALYIEAGAGINFTGSTIQSNGGDGGNGADGLNPWQSGGGGGGAGGNGGTFLCLYNGTLTSSPTLTLTGGAGGTGGNGVNGGTNGATGASGVAGASLIEANRIYT